MGTPSEEAPAYASWIGRVFDDRYRLVRILGEGGMGAVFVAEHLRLHKEVAFKIIRPEIASDPKIAARFSREAMATAQIESPHIASAVDYGELPEGGAYLVTQLARGPSLRALLHKGALPWPRAAEIAAQIADALATAHNLGIIHRDLKPDNIIVGERDDGAPLAIVLDFGIASLSAEATVPSANTSEPLTSFGLVLGTPGYMAPEQAVGDRIDPRTDLYALGVILWESVTGDALWNGDSLTGIVSQQMRSAAPRLREVAGNGVPEALDDLCDALLARAPAQRPASAGEVRNALRNLAAPADSAPPSLRPTTATALSSDASLPTIPEYSHETGPMTRPGEAAKRNRQVLLLLAVCFLIGGGVLISAAISYFGDDEAASSDDTSATSKQDKRRGRMSIHDDEPADAQADDGSDDDKGDDEKGDGRSDSDEFEVVKDAAGHKRLIRRLRP